MTPKEKANELVDKFMDYSQYKLNEKHNMSNVYTAKKCALISINSTIQALDDVLFPNPFRQYWEQVKKEVINI